MPPRIWTNETPLNRLLCNVATASFLINKLGVDRDRGLDQRDILRVDPYLFNLADRHAVIFDRGALAQPADRAAEIDVVMGLRGVELAAREPDHRAEGRAATIASTKAPTAA